MNDETSVVIAIRSLNNLLRRGYFLLNKDEFSQLWHRGGMVIAYLIDAKSDVFQRDIEKVFMLRRPSATALLNELEKAGLIMRSPVESDGRLKKLTATEFAVQQYNQNREEFYNLEKKMMVGISDKEQEAFISTAHKLRDNLIKIQSDI